jgi:uncharacterized repeat protein (TIGR01451 family)
MRHQSWLARGIRALGPVAIGVVAVAAMTFAIDAQAAAAITPSPQWTVTAVSAPTNFLPEDQSGDDLYRVSVTNTGGAASNGAPITITDELPTGLQLAATGASGTDRLTGATLSCVLATCSYSGVVVPDDTLVLTFAVDVEPDVPASVTNVVRVAGGGAVDASMSTPTAISTSPAGFGIAPGGATTVLSSTQAGAHADLTTSIAFNTVDDRGVLAQDPKDTTDELPPGFAGDLVDTPSCTVGSFAKQECPIGTQIGVTTLTLNLGSSIQVYNEPVYNLAPEPGDVAKLGFRAAVFNVQGDVSINPEGYGLRATFEDVDETPAELDSVSLSIWGDPADPIHDPWRYRSEGTSGGYFGVASDAPPAPFLANPTSCTSEPLEATFSSDSWEQPGQEVTANMTFGPMVGCDRLTLEPSVLAQPTTDLASSPTGLDVELNVPQTYSNPEGLATSHVKKVVVTLPEGMTINPSAGAGLGACTPAQFAEETAQPSPEVGCPNDSKLGTVTIQSPAIKEAATGSLYIAQPYDNPFDTLLGLYIVARIPDRGVIVKVAGEAVPNPLTGQLTTTFDEDPQLPFSNLTLSFHQGQTSPLVTPAACGTYAATTELTPWSNPLETRTVSSSFQIVGGVDGTACPTGGIPPFAPQLTAGTLDNNAGSYSQFDLRLTRNDGEQSITAFSTELPRGLVGKLAGIPYCPEQDIALARTETGAQAEEAPACPAASQIGSSLVGAGVGGVLVYTPGNIYMAGPYHGAPFSIVSITSAKVGPFDLGTVVVRFALRIDPTTAQVIVDPEGSDPIPQIISGIPIHVRDIHVYMDRPEFIFNPTSCAPTTIASSVVGTNTTASVSSHFQATNCAALAFKPKFKASTSGKASRADGASLTASVSYPDTPQGSEANIAKVKVELPKRLPSRLKTLQKACTEQSFAVNPASCPAASAVGMATAHTPVLPVPLTGPAYFVSHGGAKFPELIVVLQGDGVTVDLHGETLISKRGITSSTFRQVPDVPVSSFELRLPEGPYSALAANGNLCDGKLAMPTELVAQNGAVLKQQTKLTVSGCPKHRAKKSKLKQTKRRNKRGAARRDS